MSDTYDAMYKGLEEGGLSSRIYKLFDSVYNELLRREKVIVEGGDSNEARQAEKEIRYFVRLLKDNRMWDYLDKFPES